MGDINYNEKIKNQKVYVTKEMTFDACHFLKDYDGKCANMHGHTYKLQVTLSGKLDNTGMLVDFAVLKEICKSAILRHVDHANLNEVFPFNTTAENMVIAIYNILKDRLNIHNNLNIVLGQQIQSQNIKVECVRLWETPNSFAEYKGEVEE